MDSVFIGHNGTATTLGRQHTVISRASAQFLTEINLAGSAHARFCPPSPLPPGGLYKPPRFSAASLTLMVVVRVRRIAHTVLARARTC